MPKKSDVIVVIAHPDDEAFVSGTICLCVERGFRITLVAVTNGEGGSREVLGDAPDLGAVRRQELALSVRVLQIHELLFLNQPDVAFPGSGGAGSWDQSHVVN